MLKHTRPAVSIGGAGRAGGRSRAWGRFPPDCERPRGLAGFGSPGFAIRPTARKDRVGEGRGQDSNLRSPAYEAGELPLLHPGLLGVRGVYPIPPTRSKRTRPAPFVSGRAGSLAPHRAGIMCGVGPGAGVSTPLALSSLAVARDRVAGLISHPSRILRGPSVVEDTGPTLTRGRGRVNRRLAGPARLPLGVGEGDPPPLG